MFKSERNMIKIRILLGIVIIVCASLSVAQEYKAWINKKARPHVVFIMADDLVSTWIKFENLKMSQIPFIAGLERRQLQRSRASNPHSKHRCPWIEWSHPQPTLFNAFVHS